MDNIEKLNDFIRITLHHLEHGNFVEARSAVEYSIKPLLDAVHAGEDVRSLVKRMTEYAGASGRGSDKIDELYAAYVDLK